MKPLLKIENLSISLKKTNAPLLKNICFSIFEDEIVSIIGHSGSGKSLLTFSILDLLDEDIFIKKGKINYNNIITRKDISLILQDPNTSLNPLTRIGKQLMAIFIHKKFTKKIAKIKAFSLFDEIGLSPAENYFKRYPHEISGGEQQKVLISMALATKSKILIADEITSNLDVISQNKIINLLKQIKKKYKISIIFITHNLKLANALSNRVFIIKNNSLIIKSC